MTSQSLSSDGSTHIPFGNDFSDKDKTYLRELTMYSVSRLEKEPRHLHQESARLNREMEELAVNNYRAFVESSRCVRDACQAVEAIDTRLHDLEIQIPNFTSTCNHFLVTANAIREAQALNKLMLENESTLRDLLELPFLMDICARNELYEEALDLEGYARSLQERHPDIPLVEDIVNQMQGTLGTMRSQLLQLLQGAIQLPTCLSVIGYLKRMNAFTDQELREQFLRSRQLWLDSMLQDIAVSTGENNPYEFITKYLECNRVPLFEIITQYRSIFMDYSDDTNTPVDHPDVLDTPVWSLGGDQGLLYFWIHERVAAMLNVIEQTLPKLREGHVIASVLEQCMYCGYSLARVGVDFRALLIAPFERRVLELFQGNLSSAAEDFSDSLTRHDWHITQAQLVHMGITMHDQNSEHPSLDTTLLQYPPLAVLANSFINAFNSFRQCAPLALKTEVVAIVEKVLLAVARKLKTASFLSYTPITTRLHARTGSKTSMGHTRTASTASNGSRADSVDGHDVEEDAVTVLSRAYVTTFVPWLHAILYSMLGGDAQAAIGAENAKPALARAKSSLALATSHLIDVEKITRTLGGVYAAATSHVVIPAHHTRIESSNAAAKTIGNVGTGLMAAADGKETRDPSPRGSATVGTGLPGPRAPISLPQVPPGSKDTRVIRPSTLDVVDQNGSAS